MGKKWRQLKYEDRLKIYAWLQDKTSVATIAKRLGVCRQTIYREIKRGEFVKRNTDYTESTVYDPYVAEEHYQKKLKERGRDLKIGSDLKLLHYIEKKIVDEKKIKLLFFESHWCYRNRLDEMREFFNIPIVFKIGVETFDFDFRNNFLNKNARFRDPREVAEKFQSVCLMVGIKGQTREMIKRDIEIVLEHFKYATINVFVNNTTEIKRDEELVQWFKDEYEFLNTHPKVEVLYHNTDFGVGD